MKTLIFLGGFLFSFIISASAPEMIVDLYGFRIGQFREVVKKGLGDPVKSEKYQDGFEYEVYILNPDSSLYMIFEYAPPHLDVIWSIQLTGKKEQTGFKDLVLGMDESVVFKSLGAPSRKIDIGKYGTKLEYDQTNYSVEINAKGKLSSIKITDESRSFFPKPDVSKIQTFEEIKKILMSGDRKKLETILCPDMEIHYGDSVYFFRNRMSEEIRTDPSGIFKLIQDLSADLQTVDVKNNEQYEENIRVRQGQDPMHVIKIKKGKTIKEIVFKFMFGRYLIWEIRA
jgi:hypothetical protein